jgi:hypothetical protein
VSLVCILALLLMERAGLVSIIGSNIICKSKSKMTLFLSRFVYARVYT